MNALAPGALKALHRPATALMPQHPDAALLALRGGLDAAVEAMGAANTVKADDDEAMNEASGLLSAAVKAIAVAGPARTDEGRALKAAAVMQELRGVFSENFGDWPGVAERMAWNLLSDLAGDVYVPPDMPQEVRRNCEPPRLPFDPVFEACSAGLPDAELIRICAAFCDLERAYDATGTGDEDAACKERERIADEQQVLVDRMCSLPCATLEGVQAMATALATWDRELLRDIPAKDAGDQITSNMVERLLALRPHDVHLDADLLAVCAEFRVSEAAYSEIYDSEDRVLTDEECATLANPIAEGWDGMLDRMAQFRATTSEGLAARAMALAQHSGIRPGTEHYPFAFEPDEAEDVTGRLLHMLLTDAVQMICGAPLPNPDADLLALRPEFDRLHALMVAYNKDLIPDGGTECADFDGLCERIAVSTPAVTAEGRAFQAAAAMHHLYYRLNDEQQARNPAWLMLKGLAGDAYLSVEARW